MTRIRLARHCGIAAVALLLPLAACGSDETSPDGSTVTGTSSNAGQAAGGSTTKQGTTEGSIHLTVNGQKYNYPARQCRIVTTVGTNMSIDSDAVRALLPPKPGAFDDSANARVLLPESLSDEPISNALVHGNWALDGDTASGSLEGTAHTVISNTQLPFTMDFTCPYAE